MVDPGAKYASQGFTEADIGKTRPSGQSEVDARLRGRRTHRQESSLTKKANTKMAQREKATREGAHSLSSEMGYTAPKGNRAGGSKQASAKASAKALAKAEHRALVDRTIAEQRRREEEWAERKRRRAEEGGGRSRAEAEKLGPEAAKYYSQWDRDHDGDTSESEED